MNQSGTDAPARAHLSRRRILTGAAWVTPAILIATGSPPAAASPNTGGSPGFDGPPGTVAFNGTYFTNINGSNSELHLKIFHAGPENADTLTVTQVTLAVPAAQVDATLIPGSGGTGWSLVGPTVSGTMLLWVATYSGAAVEKWATSSELVVRWKAAGTTPYPLTVNVSATAKSAGQTVTGTESFTRD